MRKLGIVALALVLIASAAKLRAAQEPMPSVPEPVPTTQEATTTDNTTPEAAATTLTPPSAYAVQSGCGCEAAGGHGSVLHRLIGWCTYCPKERVGFCKSCASCQYKGALPIHLLFGRYCVNGSGMHPTLPPDCCHGCKGCAQGAP
jgi:hypothetical protein